MKMQKKSFKYTIICLILGAGFIFIVTAADYKAEFRQISSTESEISFNFKPASFAVTEKNGVRYTQVIFDGGVKTSEKGFAELPMVSASVIIPDEKDVTVAPAGEDYYEVPVSEPVLPSRGVIYRNQDPLSIPYAISPVSVNDSWYPENNSEETAPFTLRDVRGVNIYAYPVQYNAAKGTVRVYRKITVRITEKQSKVSCPLTVKPGYVDRSMRFLYASLFINYKDEKFSNQIGESGELLIIHTPRDESAVQPYIEWKKQKGFKVSAISVAAGTNVKETITEAYTANPNILYVQLVGDWADIQCDIDTSGEAPMDPMLGCIAGEDLYPELIIGRFSASSPEEVTVQVNKAINYEKTPETDGEWYSKGLGIGSPEGEGAGDDGEIDYEHIDLIKENKLLPFTYETVNEAYGNPSASVVAGYINSGLSVINYCGHGSNTSWGTSGYSNTNVNNSVNGSKLPVIFSVACVNGAFHAGTCFAEAWLRKEGGGAAATLMSSINQPWVPPMRGQDYMNDIMTGGYDYSVNPGNGFSTNISDKRSTFGSIAYNGEVLMLAEQYSNNETRETFQTWTIFGDVTLQVRTAAPASVENINETLFPELYSTRILNSGYPVEGAAVTLYQDGTAFSGVTDLDGNVNIAHAFSSGNVIITVSGFNISTIQKEVPVSSPEGPYLNLSGYSFKSDNSGSSSCADLEIKNIGLDNSESLSVTVTSSSEYVTLTGTSYSSPDLVITPGSSASVNDIFTFDIDPLTPDQTSVRFDLVIRNSTDKVIQTSMYLTVKAPVLDITHTAGSTAMQGQEQSITFRIENKGAGYLGNFTLDLEQTSSFDVTVDEPVKSIEGLAPGTYQDVVFKCYYSGNIPNSAYLTFKLTANSDVGTIKEYPYEIVVGLTDGFESGDFSGNGWVVSGDTVWLTDHAVFYEGGYSACSGVVPDGKKSELSLSLEYIAQGKITFYRKVSSEAGYDKLSFYIDGTLVKSWSGQLGWEFASYDVAPGTHIFKWTFSRDGSMGAGSNCAWIDNVLAVGISTTGIEDVTAQLPSEPVLYQNYPNPFNPVTQISFATPEAGDVNLRVYNLNGQLVSELIKGTMTAGIHSVSFNAEGLNSGIYYYTLRAGGRTETRKMLLIK